MIIESSYSETSIPLWKARQKAFYVMNSGDFEDDLSKHEVINIKRHELAYDIFFHFQELPKEFRYPSKSYVVAMVYARLLSEFFGGDKMDYLNDSGLLFGNDPCFLPYDRDRECYDRIIEAVGWDFDLNKGTPNHVVPYFMEEFLITDKEKEAWNETYP